MFIAGEGERDTQFALRVQSTVAKRNIRGTRLVPESVEGHAAEV